jgi:hypothetical protein
MAEMTGRDKLRTLLPHWIEHNAEHAADFRLWVKQASEVEAEIEEAAARMEEANEALAAALAKLGGSMGNHDHHHSHAG